MGAKPRFAHPNAVPRGIGPKERGADAGGLRAAATIRMSLTSSQDDAYTQRRAATTLEGAKHPPDPLAGGEARGAPLNTESKELTETGAQARKH